MPLAVVAIGGNALSRAEEAGTVEEQFANARTTSLQLVRWVNEGWDLILTHGNGPQVGNMLWRVELAAQQVHPVDLGICDANAQGQIGYMLQQVMGNQFLKQGITRNVVTLVTQVEVSPDDPAFTDPEKPIGRFFDRKDAEQERAEHGWVMREFVGRGWRRLVPSPTPLRILELEAIRDVVRAGNIPIAGGGGGIPVIRGPDGAYRGVEAVIDKDRTASLLARRVAADVLVICTDTPRVYTGFGSPQQTPVDRASVEQLRTLLAADEFPPGNMGPKVRACVDFVAGGGVGTRRRAIVTDMHNLGEAISGRAGTVVVP